MELRPFQINVVEQSWLDGSLPDQDLCSHGKIKLVIGGESVTSGNEDYGVSESALALLRTLKSDHSSENPVAQLLIFHGCGTMLMMGCPIGVDWKLTHSNGRVHISNVVRHVGVGESDVATFLNLVVDMSEAEYSREVVAFANVAKELFAGVAKVFTDEFDRQQYEEFWAEYDRLLNAYANAV